jgi:hypothetical protein
LVRVGVMLCYPHLNVHAISYREVVLAHLNQLCMTLRFFENCSWQEPLKQFEHIFYQSAGGRLLMVLHDITFKASM